MQSITYKRKVLFLMPVGITLAVTYFDMIYARHLVDLTVHFSEFNASMFPYSRHLNELVHNYLAMIKLIAGYFSSL